MLKPQNEIDKDRFEKLTETQVERGRGETKATEVAASEENAPPRGPIKSR
jgi:hypothetical protein